MDQMQSGQVPPTPPPPVAAPAERPTGVTILAVLAAIGGVLGLLGALALIGLGGLASAAGAGFLAGIVAIVGLVALVQAVLSLAFAYGAWTLKPWAWVVGVAAEVIQLVISVLLILDGADISSQIISVIIAGVILYYLWTPQVKAAFGRP
jgi:hypothetical protein